MRARERISKKEGIRALRLKEGEELDLVPDLDMTAILVFFSDGK